MVCTRFTYDVHMIYKWLLYDTRWCGVRSQGSSVRECCGVTIPWVHIVARPCNYKVFQHIVGCDMVQLQSVPTYTMCITQYTLLLPHCWLRYGAIAKCCWIVERLWAPAVSIHPFLPTLSNFHLCGLLSNFHSAPEESQFKLNLFRKSVCTQMGNEWIPQMGILLPKLSPKGSSA